MNFQQPIPPVSEAERVAAIGEAAQLFARESSRKPAIDQLVRTHFNRYWNRAYEQGAIDGFLEASRRREAEIAGLCHALRFLAAAITENMVVDNPLLKTAFTLARNTLAGDCGPRDEHAGDPAFLVHRNGEE